MNKFFTTIKRYSSDFIGLFYPELCAACHVNLYEQEKILCTKCLYELPRTNYHKEPGNPLEKLFWGRVPVERVSSYFFFKKGSRYQKLIHLLKYHGRDDVGIELGRLFGADLAGEPDFRKPDFIIPVPLHPKKEKKRGYNQSALIAQGLGEFLPGKVDKSILLRKTFTQTQTKKSRYERWENVEEVFEVMHPEVLEGKHVLLVDDILTTGATLEGCAQVLQKAAQVKISIVTLGYATI
ncbi:MAG: ComF family protein [Salinivirgaceae bacterium]